MYPEQLENSFRRLLVPAWNHHCNAEVEALWVQSQLGTVSWEWCGDFFSSEVECSLLDTERGAQKISCCWQEQQAEILWKVLTEAVSSFSEESYNHRTPLLGVCTQIGMCGPQSHGSVLSQQGLYRGLCQEVTSDRVSEVCQWQTYFKIILFGSFCTKHSHGLFSKF